MKRIAIAATVAASLALSGCAFAADPNVVAHYNAVTAVATSKANAERDRALALTAIAKAGDDRVRDRAIAELSKGVDIGGVAQYVAPPNAFLQFLSVVANPIAMVALGLDHNKTSIALGAQSVQSHAITFGAIQGIATQGIQSTQALGQAGIDKIMLEPAPIEGAGEDVPAVVPE